MGKHSINEIHYINHMLDNKIKHFFLSAIATVSTSSKFPNLLTEIKDLKTITVTETIENLSNKEVINFNEHITKKLLIRLNTEILHQILQLPKTEYSFSTLEDLLNYTDSNITGVDRSIILAANVASKYVDVFSPERLGKTIYDIDLYSTSLLRNYIIATDKESIAITIQHDKPVITKANNFWKVSITCRYGIEIVNKDNIIIIATI